MQHSAEGKGSCLSDAFILIVQVAQHLHRLQVFGLVGKLMLAKSHKGKAYQICAFNRPCTARSQLGASSGTNKIGDNYSVHCALLLDHSGKSVGGR